ncbi:MAG: hypothetical protein HC838_17730, partial [Spirulinaceae cyanobacterium RM2_2_10]|nr:hypothetical protein [Spirulinaceae cyanobacterium RM2_2_10]
RAAAEQSGATVLLKGARTAIAGPEEDSTWVVPASTPALARGGSGDVLTGLLGGLLAQPAPAGASVALRTAVAAWWHARAGCRAAAEQTELGVDPLALSRYLIGSQTVEGDRSLK